MIQDYILIFGNEKVIITGLVHIINYSVAFYMSFAVTLCDSIINILWKLGISETPEAFYTVPGQAGFLWLCLLPSSLFIFQLSAFLNVTATCLIQTAAN